MSALPNTKWTREAYLAFERASEQKHELIDGEIYAMSGASREHSLIVLNIASSFHGQLRGKPCEAYVNDMRVRVQVRNYVYPDIVIVCGEPQLEDDQLDTLLNPSLVVEVLSPSTEQYDRGRKFENYRAIDSLQAYVLIAQDRAHVELFVRQNDGRWLFSEVNGLDASLTLDAVGCVLTLSEIYERVTLGEDE